MLEFHRRKKGGGCQRVKEKGLQDTHWLADKPVSITNLDLAVQPHRRHLLQPLEAEGVELEGGAAIFAVFKDGHSAVGGAADGRQRRELGQCERFRL